MKALKLGKTCGCGGRWWLLPGLAAKPDAGQPRAVAVACLACDTVATNGGDRAGPPNLIRSMRASTSGVEPDQTS